MGAIDDAWESFGKGTAAAKKAYREKGVSLRLFAEEFVRTCSDGWKQGWHESNGGNLSYRLSAYEAGLCSPFVTPDDEWNPLSIPCPAMASTWLLVSASGAHMRNMEEHVFKNAGLVEISADGTSWRRVWGFEEGARPTSELEAHLQCFAAKISNGIETRVVYHVHPTSVIALSALLEADERAVTKALWTATTESIIAFPHGIGAVGFMIPGSPELAQATAAQLMKRDAVMWASHGILVTGESFDEAFGRAQTADKAASVILALQGKTTVNDLSIEDVKATAARYGIDIAEELL